MVFSGYKRLANNSLHAILGLNNGCSKININVWWYKPLSMSTYEQLVTRYRVIGECRQ